jgi:hypothetical protein
LQGQVQGWLQDGNKHAGPKLYEHRSMSLACRGGCRKMGTCTAEENTHAAGPQLHLQTKPPAVNCLCLCWCVPFHLEWCACSRLARHCCFRGSPTMRTSTIHNLSFNDNNFHTRRVSECHAVQGSLLVHT